MEESPSPLRSKKDTRHEAAQRIFIYFNPEL
jgi:hypothetical protein